MRRGTSLLGLAGRHGEALPRKPGELTSEEAAGIPEVRAARTAEEFANKDEE